MNRTVPAPSADSRARDTDRGRRDHGLGSGDQPFRSIVESVPLFVWSARADGVADYHNPQLLAYLGESAGELPASDWTGPLHPDDRDRALRAWQAALATGSEYSTEFRIRRASDGVYRWFRSRAVPVRDSEGVVARWYGFVTDIHDLKEAEEALRDADRRKDNFLAMLAHELRNPLAPIKNAVQILRLVGSPEPEPARAQEVIDRQVQHLSRLVDDLLDVSRIARGKVHLKREPVDLRTVITRAVETSRPAIDARRHTLTVSLAPNLHPVQGDAVRLTQAVCNLLDNAAKYTPEGGQIFLTVQQEPDEAVVHVEDTGVGIPADMLAKVFDLFAQADHARDRSHGGLGIGLTLARSIVQMHGGVLEASSAGPGQGSEFTLRFPVLPDRRAEPAVEGPVPAIPLAPRRVLVVDDNADSADSLAMLLTLAGHRVETALDGPGALAAAADFRPEVILLDIGLPGMDGYEVARRLWATEPRPRPLVVALTGYTQGEDRRRAREAGFDYFLVKPVDPVELERIIGMAAGDLKAGRPRSGPPAPATGP